MLSLSPSLEYQKSRQSTRTYQLKIAYSIDLEVTFSAGLVALLEFRAIEQRKVLNKIEADGKTLKIVGEQKHQKMPEVERYLKTLTVSITFLSDQTLILVPNAELFFHFSDTLFELIQKSSATQETRTVLAVSVPLLIHFDSYIRDGRDPENRERSTLCLRSSQQIPVVRFAF